MFSILRNNKKGALELSMNAIVIIVLAFAMLGLGLVFTRTLLTQATQSAGSVTDTAKQQILDSLREGNKKLSVQQEVKMQSSDSTVIGVGLKNTAGAQKYFKILIFSGATDVTDAAFTKGAFTFSGTKRLAADEADVIPIRYNAPTTKETNLYTIKVYAMDTNTDPVLTGTSATSVYATADIFITVQ